MSLKLSDALSQFKATTDSNHRYWGYFQAMAVGATAFAWSREDASIPLFVVITVSFAAFAGVSNWLVVDSQRSVCRLKAAINAYVEENPAEVPNTLMPLIAELKPASDRTVRFWHVCISLAVLGAIWWRFAQLRC